MQEEHNQKVHRIGSEKIVPVDSKKKTKISGLNKTTAARREDKKKYPTYLDKGRASRNY